MLHDVVYNACVCLLSQFAVKFNKADIPSTRARAYGAYVVPTPRTSGKTLLLSNIENCEW